VRSKKLISIIDALETAADSNGYQLVDVELGGAGHRTLVRVFISKPEGLTLDDVAEANGWISETLDALDPFTGSYTLEVSSPGIDRPLRKLEHFEQAINEVATITIDQQADKARSKYTGIVKGIQCDPDVVLLEIDGQLETINFSTIKKAHIKGQVSFEDRKDA
jgi:ribosome maturation factor RimP